MLRRQYRSAQSLDYRVFCQKPSMARDASYMIVFVRYSAESHHIVYRSSQCLALAMAVTIMFVTYSADTVIAGIMYLEHDHLNAIWHTFT